MHLHLHLPHIAELTNMQLFFAAAISVGVSYLVAKSIDLLTERRNADKRPW